MDWKKLLTTSVELDRDIRAKRSLTSNVQTRIKNVYMALDVELAEIANANEWFKTWKTHKGKRDGDLTVRETVLNEYVDGFDFFLLLGYLNQWNHLIPVDEKTLENYQKDTRKADLTLMYLNIKKMLYSSYSMQRASDYEHSWHMFLKFGINGLGYSPKEIQDAFFAKNHVNYERQDSGY